MDGITDPNHNSRECVTSILDQATWGKALRSIVDFLSAKGVAEVRVEFGFVLDRDLAGKPQTPDSVVQLSELEPLIRKGLDEGTIEWNRSSDFRFHPLGLDLRLMLCNDADLHYASADRQLLAELSDKLREVGIRINDPRT